jgi:hypothetical protein
MVDKMKKVIEGWINLYLGRNHKMAMHGYDVFNTKQEAIEAARGEYTHGGPLFIKHEYDGEEE